MLKYYLDKTGKVIKSILFPSSEFVDTEPRVGSLNPVTSGGVAGSVAQQSSNLAPDYTKKTYEANSYVMHDGVLYTNPNAIGTAEDWNPAHWTQTTVAEMMAGAGALKNGGTLTSSTAITVPNNASSFCAITEAAGDVIITVETEADEVPNFAFTFTTVNDITISVEHDIDDQTDTLLYSVAGGNEATGGKTYQLTCVGDCWTLAEFTNTP